jgi:hypothetical protein
MKTKQLGLCYVLKELVDYETGEEPKIVFMGTRDQLVTYQIWYHSSNGIELKVEDSFIPIVQAVGETDIHEEVMSLAEDALGPPQLKEKGND